MCAFRAVNWSRDLFSLRSLCLGSCSKPFQIIGCDFRSRYSSPPQSSGDTKHGNCFMARSYSCCALETPIAQVATSQRHGSLCLVTILHLVSSCPNHAAASAQQAAIPGVVAWPCRRRTATRAHRRPKPLLHCGVGRGYQTTRLTRWSVRRRIRKRGQTKRCSPCHSQCSYDRSGPAE